MTPPPVTSNAAPDSATGDLSLFGFIESVSDGVVIVDQQDRVVMANRAALGLIGHTRDATLGQPVAGAFRIFLERMRSRKPSGPMRFEHFYDNEWYMVQIYALVSPDGQSSTAYTIVLATEVSLRKRREFDFIETVAGLEEATRIAQMGTFKTIWQTGQIEWSPHMYTLHGVTPDTYNPASGGYAKFVHPDDRDYVQRANRDLAQGNAIANVQYRLVLNDDVLRWMRIDSRVLFDSSGAPYASFGTCQDITETKRREEELRELLRRNAILYEALEASPNGVAVLTAEETGLTILYVNAAFEQLTQHNSFSLNTAGLDALVTDDQSRVWRSFNAAMNASEGGAFEVDCRRRDGSVFPAQVELAAVRDHPGRAATAYVITVRDLTAEKERAAVLLQSQKMEALGQLSGGVAHEINNLLQPVIALSDLGADVLERDPGKAKQYFEVIGNSGRKAREVVRQVLTFARRDTPQLLSHDVLPLVIDAINLAAKGLPPNIVVETHLDLEDAKATLSATQISQVILNLMRNASDAMNGRGRIVVDLRRCAAEDVPAGMDRARPWIRLIVKDEGCGIDAQALARVFEPFFTTKPVGKGTGLGLSVVYSIVNTWGGTIKIDSEVDQGTTAVIYIPEQI
ncbi:MAG: PAS domain S-box protein [Rhodospirillaceae bacterium]|nr:PAS domain S-box protein [Rhodospirillaceae bacterium]